MEKLEQEMESTITAKKKMVKQLDAILQRMKIEKGNQKVFNLNEVVEYYNFKPRNMKSWLRQGIVPHYKLNNEILFHKDILDAWLLGKIEDNYRNRGLENSIALLENRVVDLKDDLKDLIVLGKDSLPKQKSYSPILTLLFLMLSLNTILFLVYLFS